MDRFFLFGGFGVELHGVAFEAHDGSGMSCEEDVGDLCEGGVGEVLHHQVHSMFSSLAEAEEGASEGFAGLEGDAGPAQLSAEADKSPVVCALIHEEGLAGADAVDVDLVCL